jgi:hypothetical protein
VDAGFSKKRCETKDYSGVAYDLARAAVERRAACRFPFRHAASIGFRTKPESSFD